MFTKLFVRSAPIVAIAAFTSIAQADSNQDFTLHNATGFMIGELHVSSANNDRWGPDVLGQDVLNPGDKVRVSFSGYKPSDCIFDIKIRKGEDGPAFVVEDVNLCQLDDIVFFQAGGRVLFKKF